MKINTLRLESRIDFNGDEYEVVELDCTYVWLATVEDCEVCYKGEHLRLPAQCFTIAEVLPYANAIAA